MAAKYETYIPELDGEKEVWVEELGAYTAEEAAEFATEDCDYQVKIFVREINKPETKRAFSVERTLTCDVVPLP